MYTVVFNNAYSEAWRQVQAEPIRRFCICAMHASGRGCVNRRSRASRRSKPRSQRRRSHVTRGRSSEHASSDGPGNSHTDHLQHSRRTQ
jgi:hypothetical protein